MRERQRAVRHGDGSTRDAILVAARSAFGERGFERATIRAIAASAGVDPALVMYFFGSKRELFLAAIELLVKPAEAMPGLLEPGRAGLAERLVRFHLDLCSSEDTGPAFVGLFRSAFSNEAAAEILREFVGRQLIAPIAAALEGPDAALRAELVGSQLVGLLVARYIVRIEPLASVDTETVVAAVAPVIDGYLTGPDAGFSEEDVEGLAGT